jgi:mono/diheme cytochrome c family protein
MKTLLRCLAAIAAVTAAPAWADATVGTVSIELPPETARLQPGAGVETATASCMICHSVDYIYMQPPLTKDQWRGEVVKMKNTFGAPFPESDIDTIVTYLLSQNGKP